MTDNFYDLKPKLNYNMRKGYNCTFLWCDKHVFHTVDSVLELFICVSIHD